MSSSCVQAAPFSQLPSNGRNPLLCAHPIVTLTLSQPFQLQSDGRNRPPSSCFAVKVEARNHTTEECSLPFPALSNPVEANNGRTDADSISMLASSCFAFKAEARNHTTEECSLPLPVLSNPVEANNGRTDTDCTFMPPSSCFAFKVEAGSSATEETSLPLPALSNPVEANNGRSNIDSTSIPPFSCFPIKVGDRNHTTKESSLPLPELLNHVEANNRKTHVDSISMLHQLLAKDIQSNENNNSNALSFLHGDGTILHHKIAEIRKRNSWMLKKDSERFLEDFSLAVDPQSLVVGDYVVHKTKGIGKFVCLREEISQQGPEKYVYLQYADQMAKLKSTQACRLLYRYRQPVDRGRAPALSKLSDGSQWEKKKNKGRLAVQKMVVDLMQLYVQRLKQHRPPYPKNSEALAEFASKFPYIPTPDQEQAFKDIERDMTEHEIPMDRLICGDSGFGKTEVALRAIFRVVATGRQVMVLAPTTVLARQHYNVIRDRFAGYPVRVALFSRFQTNLERRTLAAEIKSGSLNIIVGTHALLGNHIRYSYLGLLVVDEEQRFGVKQKEHITSLRATVDVLTLSATPIPRTLYLALTGFRDASLIATPPPERMPITTRVSEYHEETIKAAIKFELARGGHIFYVIPRIKGIGDKKRVLENLFPNTVVGTVHGKQCSVETEVTMERFAAGGIHILLCTNIIECGLDIRTANTIIIEDVHLLGLSQIYQLRGRVGRADKEAYAYLFYPHKKLLSDEALERLVALEACCELGQGFQLAQRDMVIRGFGSVFGEEQSGEVHLGIDLFTEMLFENLLKADADVYSQLKFESVKLEGLKLTDCIPSEYVEDPNKREAIPHELQAAACGGLHKLMHYTDGLRSQFGKEPPSVEELLKVIYIRRIAADLGISSIWRIDKRILMETHMSTASLELLKDTAASKFIQSSLIFGRGQIQLQIPVELPDDGILEHVFVCLIQFYRVLMSFHR